MQKHAMDVCLAGQESLYLTLDGIRLKCSTNSDGPVQFTIVYALGALCLADTHMIVANALFSFHHFTGHMLAHGSGPSRVPFMSFMCPCVCVSVCDTRCVHSKEKWQRTHGIL